MLVEGIHVEDIFELSPWFFPELYPGHLGFWSMRKTNGNALIFLSITLKQTKAGLRSSGTPFLV